MCTEEGRSIVAEKAASDKAFLITLNQDDLPGGIFWPQRTLLLSMTLQLVSHDNYMYILH